VLITGEAGVLGGEIACALMGCNANVVIPDRDQELAQKTIEPFPKAAKGHTARMYWLVRRLRSAIVKSSWMVILRCSLFT
jgi:NAD(P)-dependent dehydrogenase (short-subunit alcohol dehydrogenase family)